MERRKKLLLPLIAIVAGACYFVASGHDEGNDGAAGALPGSPQQPVTASTGAAGESPARGPARGPAPAAGSGVFVSPFGSGAPAPARPMAERIRVRREHMKALGLDTPEGYYFMPVPELRERAEKRDVMAMLQLAVQYGGESADLERDAGDNPAVDPREEQKKYLISAFNAGHIRSAALLARLYWQENNAIDAYAWHLLAERLWDTSGSTWARAAFAGLSPAGRQAAERKAQALFRQTRPLTSG